MDYKQIVNMAYKKYVKDWSESRGYSPTDVDPTVGISGERYATINEFENNEFQNRAYMSKILTGEEFCMWECRKEFKFIFLKGLTYKMFQKQKSGDVGRCPRCGGEMNPRASHNSLSRRTDIYICNSCGMKEAIEDAKKAKDPNFEKTVVEEWDFAKNISYK